MANGHGGARKGAGQPKKLKRAVKKVMAEAILESIDELGAWQDLLGATSSVAGVVCADYTTRFKALSYLTNRRDGMPSQTVAHSNDGDSPLRVLVEHIAGYTNKAPAKTNGTAKHLE